MDKQLYKYANKQIKQSFSKYKRIQVGATIKEVLVQRKKRVGRCIGFQMFSDCIIAEEKLTMIPFKRVYNVFYGIRMDVHQLYVAVDQRTNTVYWNFERLNSHNKVNFSSNKDAICCDSMSPNSDILCQVEKHGILVMGLNKN
ncbi:hypothetical protein D3C74_302070 [compost metagenome]